MRFTQLILIVLVCASVTVAQENPGFNVSLTLNYSSAERVLDLCDGRFMDTGELAAMRGNAIAAATAQYIAGPGGASGMLKSYFDSLRDQAPIANDLYHLRETRERASDIRAFLGQIQKNNFGRRVTATVEQVFPRNARVTASVPVYFVALGHQNVDAYVRRIVWHGDVPQFVGEHEGELTIVVNLARAIEYEGDLNEKFIQLLGTVAHETFHAAFGAYKDESPTWARYYRQHKRPFDVLMDITQNEGIAYYLSIDQAGQGRLPWDWPRRSREVMISFNEHADELMSETLTPRRAQELIRSANLSGGDWQSYGAMTGMVMARAIDTQVGRAALIESIALGPIDFFQKYLTACDRQGDLPPLSKRVAAVVTQP